MSFNFNPISQYKPLREPSSFVIKTHEFLKKQLARLVEDDNRHTKFRGLINKAKEEKLIYRDEKNIADNPISILYNLNDYQNCFGHPDLEPWEEWSRSIIYLMNLAMVWSKVVIDAENSYE